jgi:peptidoglycan hydrolase-like protein with peptidoglycan-binding domain
VKRAACGAAVLLAAAVIGGVVVTSGAEPSTSAAQAPPVNTATVEQGELSDMVSLDGTLIHRARSDGSPYPVINQARGIYTKLPGEGDRVDCGDVLYRVDDQPVLLLCGRVPAYRDVDVGDQGDDVRQLNRNLHRLGYDADAGIDPDDRDFTWKTEQALHALRGDKGVEDTGAHDLGDAVVLPAAGRIAKVTGELGGSARPGAPVAQATSGTLEVQVDLQASQQGEVRKGDRAQVTLPGFTSVKGRVDRLGRVARIAGDDGDVGHATIPAYIRLDTPGKARGLDRAPVQVEITTKWVKRALSVPVTALVGKAGGGFAVEVVRAGGRRELVAVRLGLFDTTEGRVAVEGDLDVGDHVVVPSL